MRERGERGERREGRGAKEERGEGAGRRTCRLIGRSQRAVVMRDGRKLLAQVLKDVILCSFRCSEERGKDLDDAHGGRDVSQQRLDELMMMRQTPSAQTVPTTDRSSHTGAEV